MKSHIQLKIQDASMFVVYLVNVTTKVIKLLQCIYNKDLRNYIRILFNVKTIKTYGIL